MNPLQDVFLLDCPKYEDYLDTFIIRNDLRYLRNIRFSRKLVEFGYRSTNEIYTPEQYQIRKAAAHEAMFPIKKSLVLFHVGIDIKDPVVYEFAQRERSNHQKILSTIIFLRHKQKSGFETSAYIDFEHSLRKSNLRTDDSTDWLAVFVGRKKLRPKPTDLSYYNSRNNSTFHNDSDNYTVVNDHDSGLLFMHKGDRKKICVDMKNERYKHNSFRTMSFSASYGHVIFYDHIIRKKA